MQKLAPLVIATMILASGAVPASAQQPTAPPPAFYWSDEDFGYAMAARADRGLLLRIAELVYHQTSPDGAKAKIPPAPGKPC